MAYWRNMATKSWLNNGSGNGLVPDYTKALGYQSLLNIPIREMSLKTALVKLLTHLSVGNELSD